MKHLPKAVRHASSLKIDNSTLLLTERFCVKFIFSSYFIVLMLFFVTHLIVLTLPAYLFLPFADSLAFNSFYCLVLSRSICICLNLFSTPFALL